jgi:hypothetical protein
LPRPTATAKVCFLSFPPASFHRNVFFFDIYASFCLTAVPEATIEALRSQVVKLQGTTLSFPVNLFFFHSIYCRLLIPFFPVFRRERAAHQGAPRGTGCPEDRLEGAEGTGYASRAPA